MEAQLVYDVWMEIYTTEGYVVIPYRYVSSDKLKPISVRVKPYIEGKFISFEKIHGWATRLSMPGFLDCTPWVLHESHKKAEEYLEEYVEDWETVE